MSWTFENGSLLQQFIIINIDYSMLTHEFINEKEIGWVIALLFLTVKLLVEVFPVMNLHFC